MKFTKEEVSLCSQVAEKHRKFIEYGGWFLNAQGKVSCASGYAYPVNQPVRREHENPKWIALWTISDCLEFLRGKGWTEIVIEINPQYCDDIKCFAERGNVDKGYEREVDGKGKTTLEACLKVVIEVLKNEKL